MKIIIIISFIAISLNLYGQTSSDTTGIKLFNRGLEHYNKGSLDSTLILWTKIVDEKIGVHYDTYGNAFFNIPTIYWQMKNYEKAKEWYKRIIASDLRDNDETGSLMEPHTNYKHKSAIALAGLFQIDSNYKEVLNWLNIADTLYRYWGFEGSATSITKGQAYLLEWKTDVFLRMDSINQAKHAIIIELICSDRLESFFESSEDTLLTLVNNENFKVDFDKALENLEIIEKDSNNWTANFVYDGLLYQIPISNSFPDRNIPHYWRTFFIDKSSRPNKKEIVDYIKNRSFYKRIKK